MENRRQQLGGLGFVLLALFIILLSVSMFFPNIIPTWFIGGWGLVTGILLLVGR